MKAIENLEKKLIKWWRQILISIDLRKNKMGRSEDSDL